MTTSKTGEMGCDAAIKPLPLPPSEYSQEDFVGKKSLASPQSCESCFGLAVVISDNVGTRLRKSLLQSHELDWLEDLILCWKEDGH